MKAAEIMIPERTARNELIGRVVEELSSLWDGIRDRRIGPVLGEEQRRQWLEAFSFDQPAELGSLATEVTRMLAGGVVLSQHPRCFGLFNPTPAFPAVLADLITAGINPQLAVTTHAPLATEIEAHVVRALARRVWSTGPVSGHFTSGGAEANMTAALMGLTAAHPDFATIGVRGLRGHPTLYASAECHFAWFKIAHQLGIGRDAVRLVPTDGKGRMSSSALSDLLARDRDVGAQPFLVVATAGTTNAGMVDPIASCASLAAEHQSWFHVDAAWGGAVLTSPAGRGAIPGIEQADSFTVDAHKLFSVPMGAGMLLTKRPGVLSETFRVSASYMPEGDESTDPYVTTAQWSRRFMGLKLFMTLAALGWRGYWEVIEKQIKLAKIFALIVAEDGYIIENEPDLGVVCFRHSSVSSDEIVNSIQNKQHCWISAANFEGRRVMRACVTSFRANRDDINFLVEELRGTVEEIMTKRATTRSNLYRK